MLFILRHLFQPLDEQGNPLLRVKLAKRNGLGRSYLGGEYGKDGVSKSEKLYLSRSIFNIAGLVSWPYSPVRLSVRWKRDFVPCFFISAARRALTAASGVLPSVCHRPCSKVR